VACLACVAACATPAAQPDASRAAFLPGARETPAAIDEQIAAANAAWQRRNQPGQVDAALALYLRAAEADDKRVAGLLGAMRAISFKIERGPSDQRAALAAQAIDLGTRCQQRAPGDAACAYQFAIALGQQAREHPQNAISTLAHMTALLRTAIAKSPDLDDAGPHRVLAIVLLRAPPWPLGPGDPDGALAEARAAADIAPGSADNQLVLGDALAASGAHDDALAAYQRAAAIATDAHDNPDAESLLARARAAITRISP
ncbi:MAG TPA: hypothetical protein VGO62_09565, partial [Myxococcota bacterium]